MRTSISACFALVMIWGCDGGDGRGGSTPGDDTTIDVVATPDTMEDTIPGLDTEPGEDTIPDPEDTAPMPDTEPGEDTIPDPEDTEPEPVEIPDTPVGEQLEWFLGLFNGENPVNGPILAEHFSDLVFDGASLGGYTYSFKATVQNIGPLELLGFEDEITTDYTITAQLCSPNGEVYVRALLRTEEVAPYKITFWSLLYAPDLDPDLGGPIADGELGLFAFDPYFGGIVPGAEVEAVDRNTGESFDPPVTATTVENYGWARLPLPADAGEVGLRITAPDGFVTRTYSPNTVAGTWNLNAPAFPVEALVDYLETLETEEDPGSGHLWGFVTWEEPTNSLEPPDPTLPDSFVGCTTVTFYPAGPQVLYSSPSNGWPDVPRIEPGGFTLVTLSFAPPEFETNPEADGCVQGIDE